MVVAQDEEDEDLSYIDHTLNEKYTKAVCKMNFTKIEYLTMTNEEVKDEIINKQGIKPD